MRNRLRRVSRYASLLAADCFLLLCAWELSYYVNSQHLWRHNPSWPSLWLILLMVALQISIFILLKIYWISLRNVSLELVFKGGIGFIIGHLFSGVLVSAFNPAINMLHLLLPYWSMSIVFIFGYRLAYRMTRGYNFMDTNQVHLPRTLLYGGGEVADQLLRMYRKNLLDYKILGIIDDDPLKHHTLLHGKPILGGFSDLEDIIIRNSISVVVIATMKMDKNQIEAVMEISREHGVDVKIIPSTIELESSRKTIADIRDIQVEDLLGREPVSIDRTPILEMIKGKTVAVTGAGGTIGGEICRQLMSFQPRRIIIIDIDETEVHNLSLNLNEYKTAFSEQVVPVVCDVKGEEKLIQLFKRHKPDIVFHAAAYKHVPLMEYYPDEALMTNICGSYNVVSASVKAQVEKCILISTDKAVNPTNVMGATKRMAELIGSALSTETTEIVSVRFGNVLGSRGSMLPLFMEQIREGLPITVTHRDIIRYFMTIPEAVSLVFLAGAVGQGKEVMVLDMGQPVNIYEFAEKLVKKFGDGRSKVVITGLRPGEKLYEELLTDRDQIIPTSYPKVFKSRVEQSFEKQFIHRFMDELHTRTTEEVISLLHTYIPGFVRNGSGIISYTAENEEAGSV